MDVEVLDGVGKGQERDVVEGEKLGDDGEGVGGVGLGLRVGRGRGLCEGRLSVGRGG